MAMLSHYNAWNFVLEWCIGHRDDARGAQPGALGGTGVVWCPEWAGSDDQASGSGTMVEMILEGRVPDGPQQGRQGKDGKIVHRPGHDLTLSAPKSVSLAALVGGDVRRGRACPRPRSPTHIATVSGLDIRNTKTPASAGQARGRPRPTGHRPPGPGRAAWRTSTSTVWLRSAVPSQTSEGALKAGRRTTPEAIPRIAWRAVRRLRDRRVLSQLP